MPVMRETAGAGPVPRGAAVLPSTGRPTFWSPRREDVVPPVRTGCRVRPRRRVLVGGGFHGPGEAEVRERRGAAPEVGVQDDEVPPGRGRHGEGTQQAGRGRVGTGRDDSTGARGRVR